VDLGRSYSEDTIRRFESLKARGLNCSIGDVMCTRKAMIIVRSRLKDGASGDNPEEIRETRLCKRHYFECPKDKDGVPLFTNLEAISMGPIF
jgi:hypothetical protein